MALERARSAPKSPSGGPAVDEAVFAQLVADLGAHHIGEVCQLFVQNASSGVQAVRYALDVADDGAAADAAHRLKAASGFVGATRLAALCAAVEHGVPPAGAAEALAVELRRASVELDILVWRATRPGHPSA